MNSPQNYVSLQPYVKSQTNPFEVRAAAQKKGSLIELKYEVKGPLQDLIIPRRGERLGLKLWEHTCFEIFLKEPAAHDYYEWNFSPTGEFNFFHFNGYRAKDEQFSPDPKKRPPDLRPEKPGADLFTMRVSFDNPFSKEQILVVSPTVILKTRTGEFQFWAKAHSSPKPDFHDASTFVIDL